MSVLNGGLSLHQWEKKVGKVRHEAILDFGFLFSDVVLVFYGAELSSTDVILTISRLTENKSPAISDIWLIMHFLERKWLKNHRFHLLKCKYLMVFLFLYDCGMNIFDFKPPQTHLWNFTTGPRPPEKEDLSLCFVLDVKAARFYGSWYVILAQILNR